MNQSRLWGSICVAIVLASATICLTPTTLHSPVEIVECGLAGAGLAVSIYFTPDYLNLTVDSTKKKRWAIRIRWRVIGTALVLGLLSVSGVASALALGAASVWLASMTLLAAKVIEGKYCSALFWVTDLMLLGTLLLTGHLGYALGVMLLAAAAHFSIVISEQGPFRWTAFVITSLVLLIFLFRRAPDRKSLIASIGLLLTSSLTTALLAGRAHRHNLKNVQAAMRDLASFTGSSAERIQQMWATSNQELARNWEAAALSNADARCLREWYRKNSQLYMFAISAYNLEYKRIRSNLKALRLAHGACLDYGAGNGDLLLELARRGHRVTYYDVEGETMLFAKRRALEERLDVRFFSRKEDLRESVSQSHGFDTIFSFDVLEHLPDLSGELSFLSSLLNRQGLLVFDVPAGSTKSHPMHLNHNLNVRAHLLRLGLQEERPFIRKLPFRSEEKFFFRAP